ncbi:hypothetical protein [Amycolatopsis taiwanensis]|uniref:WXG100 family type VII secretion target n=1 Tax=Amycolatopsis taiwanensis TaxID=342230 RepID=A0A9W6VDI5_9PSEU|nr:hypothetical protein [Amycolatopsis taiwanensis]GLY63502.1 hypothetical protein Atai01_01210 [Amycolatopsis taiwanensis]
MSDFADVLYDNSFQMSVAKPAFDKTFKPEDVQQMRALLDDPNVSNENKQNMLYALSDMKALSDGEVFKYAKQIGVEGPDALDIAKGGRDPMRNLVNAKASLAAGSEQQRQGQAKDQIDAGQKRLDEGNFSNSDEIIDQADAGLKIFDEFYPRYTKAGGQPTQGMSADVGGTGLDPNSLRAATAELRGINFAAFSADADALTQAGKAVSDSSGQLGQAWNNNMTEWKGSGATAANQFKSKLDSGAQVFTQALNSAPGTITQGIDTIKKQLVDFAENCLKQWGDGKMAQLTPQDVDNLLQSKQQLPGIISDLQQKIQELNNRSTLDKIVGGVIGFFVGGPIGAIAGVVGVSFADKITEDNIGEETQKYQQALTDTETKLQQFVSDYSTRAGSVQEQVANTKQGVQQSYDALLQGLGKGLEQDPFAKVGDPNQQGGDSGGGGGKTGGGGGTGGGGSGGGGTGGGGGMPPSTTPSTQPGQAEPSDPAAVADAAKKEAAEGINPITGKALEVDPSTGEPYPIDPKTGEAIKDAGETLTVQHGDNKIEMSEPGKDGKMDIKIDDGHGGAKDFKLDWGDGTSSPNPADAAQQAGDAAQQAADPAQHAGEKTYTPGPDGKIHIEDGNLKITAERPQGADGPTVVTVDDGTGKPTTYTLGESGAQAADTGTPAHAAGAATPAQPVEAGAAQAASTPGAQQSSGFAAPGGIDVEHTAEPAGAGSGTAQQSSGFAAPGGLDIEHTAEPAAAGPDTGQQTTPASTSGGLFGDSGSGGGSLFGDSGTGAGAVSGTLVGDAGSLQPGAHTGVDPQPAAIGAAPPAAVGAAPPAAHDPAGQQAALGASGFGGSGGMGMMGGMMGGMGAAGGGGEDTERSSRAYRVDGGIFNTSGAGGRISGSLDDDR